MFKKVRFYKLLIIETVSELVSDEAKDYARFAFIWKNRAGGTVTLRAVRGLSSSILNV